MMNVAAHQEKKKKKRAREEKKQSTDFKEAACCPFAVVQSAARRKNDLWERSDHGNCDPREDQQPFRPNPNGIGDRTSTLKRLLIGACALLHSLWY